MQILQALLLPLLFVGSALAHPVIEARTAPYAHGTCRVKILQFQDFWNPVPTFDIKATDNSEKEVSTMSNVYAPDGKAIDVTGRLPWVLIITPDYGGSVINFAYAGQHWDSNSHQPHNCIKARIGRGRRIVECSFSC